MSRRSCLLLPALLLLGRGTTDPECPPTARRRRGSSLFLTLFLLSAGACGDSVTEVTGVDTEVDDLLGTWSIVSMMFTPVGGGSAVEGVTGTASITFESDISEVKTYTLTFVEAQETVVEEGYFRVSGSDLILNALGDPDDVWYTVTSMSSTAATLFTEDAEFDFNGDGNWTETTLNVSMQKQ